MLTPVTLLKGREYRPRLSAPSVPGKHSPRYWTEQQLEFLQLNYPLHGAAYCASALGKSVSAIYGRANGIGLQAPMGDRRNNTIGDSLDPAIRAAWPDLRGKGAVSALAERLGVRRDVVSRRALQLGLTSPHKKEPRWTAAEEALLRIAPVNNLDRASEFFAAHGYKRSPSSIMVRCKRLNLSRRLTGIFTARAAARILGVDCKTVTAWLDDGSLPATRREDLRLPQQGGSAWSIEPAQLRQFMIDHLERIDIRKVDKEAFVALLVGVDKLAAASPP